MGLVAGVSWWFDGWHVLAFGASNVPMAPSTAFLFVLLGMLLFTSSRWPFSRVVRLFNIGGLAIVAVLSLLSASQIIGGHTLFEQWIVGDISTSTGIPVGRMSPLTAVAFLFASVALFCRWSTFNRHPVCLFTSAVLSWGIFVISEVTLTGYVSGLPPVLGNSTIPPAALTALAFMLASVAILLPSLTQMRLFQPPADTQARETVRRVVLIAVIGVVFAAALRLAIVGEDGGDVLPYVTFYPAVLIIALSTGLSGGLLATLLAGIYVQAWLHGGELTATEWLALTVFLIGSTLTSLICEAMRQSRAGARRAGIELERALLASQQAANALQESERRFRSVFEQAAVGMARLAPDGTWLDVNDKLCSIVGYTREELLSKSFQDTTHPDDLQADLDYVDQLLQGRIRAYAMEKRYYKKSGDVVWINLAVSLERDHNGNPAYLISVIEDITERVELHNRIEKIAAHVPGMIYQFQQWPDGHAVFPYASIGIRDIYGVEPDEAAADATPVFDVLHPDDRPRVEAKVAESMRELTTWRDSYRITRPDGRLIWVEGEASPEPQPDGSVLWHGSIRDVTDRKQAEEKLRLAASVFQHSFEAILITDAENRIVDTNPAFSAITGYEQSSVLGQDPKILASGRHDEAFFRQMWDAITQKGSWQGEIWNRRKDGELYAELLSISAVRRADRSVANYIGMFSDISELKAHEAELDRIANYDQLTGLPNRRLLFDRIEQASARAQRSGRLMAVCYLDLDDFKPINDQYGHGVGDQVLIGIAGQLRKVLRAQDTVARLGGDEFVMLLNDLTRLEDMLVLLERVLAACGRPIVLDGVTHRVSASIGVTLSPPDGLPDVDSADILLRHADQAMYRAKEAGRNRYHLYDAKQDRQLQDRRLKLQRIKEALAGDELVLFYQPKVDMVSREVIGVEALIRWRHPQEGLLLPGAFLPVIEGSDLEIAIGEWVIAAALNQVAIWKRGGLDLPISVNISAGHLSAPSFARRLGELLAAHPECDPGCLEMEILETSALSDIVQAGQTLKTCRALGVRFALDDFGTGYSSLAYFRRLPIDVLKVDQSFVRDMLDDPEDMDIVESVVRLARAFKRVVIAEGVETPEHGALLILLGCPLGQGFGIARPMPADAVPAWVSTWPEQGEGMVVEQGIGKDDIPLMMAMQNHRRWVETFVEALEDADISRLAEIEREPCRFGRWYQGSGSAHYGTLEQFDAVGRSHVAAHEVASAIMAIAEQGEMDAARAQLPSLFKARDELIGHLEGFIGRLKTAGD
ncbi:EAL domain-containing protein [Thiocapsa marina]|uniref:EAL domain-containing protein n=1 Tax=Thiocapsa marina TaxID=244573 RepID=UPI0006834551|nr:EAL domain-containing protein [Thiocapsa marina]